jgi:hypothetical protein
MEVVGRLRRSRTKNDLYDHDDYIAAPKASGYRCYHVMFKYGGSRTEFGGLRIEVQVRTRQQHFWATAVEAVGLFIAQDLKGSLGDQRWLRFFTLMGSEVAYKENTPNVPGTPDNHQERRDELRALAKELDALKKLDAYRLVLDQVVDPTSSIFLLILDTPNDALSVAGYPTGRYSLAQSAYEQAEAENREKAGVDVVLVAADSMDAVRRAYPNYFADTAAFRSVVEEAIR